MSFVHMHRLPPRRIPRGVIRRDRLASVAVLLATLILPCSGPAGLAQSSPSPYSDDAHAVEEPGSALRRITDDLHQRALAIEHGANRRIDSLREELDGLKDLRRRVTLLEEIMTQQERATQELKVARYRAGGAVLVEIEKKARMAAFVHELAGLGDFMSSNVSIWNDPVLRNGWDEIGTWGTVIGGAVATTAPLFSTEDRAPLYVGIGVMGLAQLLGRLLGTDYVARAATTLDFLSLTRAAYDDALIRVREAEAMIARDSVFIVRVTEYRREYETASDTAGAVRGALRIVEEYESMLRQIPECLSGVERTLMRYQERFGGRFDDGDDRNRILTDARIDDILARVRRLTEEYRAYALPVLQVTPETRRMMVAGG